MPSYSNTWLVTGGAGYIGSHIVESLITEGIDVAVIDSLSSGLKTRLTYLEEKYRTDIPLLKADIRDLSSVDSYIKQMRPDGVIHAAALKSVSKSLLNPEEYLDVNYAATVNLLNILKSNNVDNFIFSSTAAVYGSPDLKRGIKETDVTVPISPYGSSKLSAEKAIGDLLEEHQFHGTSLRFFNVVGCSAPELKDNSVENLIPIVLNNIEARKPPIIFGDTYDTPDGTCIRDFVDVRDVARAHLQCLKGLRGLPKIINVGTGQGTSVAQAIKIIQEISESNLEPIFDKARPGDAAHLFADVDLAFDTLGFQAEYSLVDSVKTLFAKNK